jgi:hypothetical protein
VVSRTDASQYGNGYAGMRLLVVSIKHFSVNGRPPFTPPIMAFKRELYSFIFNHEFRHSEVGSTNARAIPPLLASTTAAWFCSEPRTNITSLFIIFNQNLLQEVIALGVNARRYPPTFSTSQALWCHPG